MSYCQNTSEIMERDTQGLHFLIFHKYTRHLGSPQNQLAEASLDWTQKIVQTKKCILLLHI